MCGPHEDTDTIFGPVRLFGWHDCSTPSYHKLNVALNFLLMSLARALSQDSVTRTKNFFSHALPARYNSAGYRTRRANADTSNPRRLTRPVQDSSAWRNHCPPDILKGGNGAEVPFHNSNFIGIKIDLEQIYCCYSRTQKIHRKVFYNLCYCFCGQHCCWIETSIISNEFFCLL